VIKSILLYVIYFYQKFISKHKKYQCACHTRLGELSCSAHAVETLKHQPLSKAMKLIYHRSKKCRSLNQEFSYKQTYSQYGTLAVALVFATGCGGGGGDETTPTSNVTKVLSDTKDLNLSSLSKYTLTSTSNEVPATSTTIDLDKNQSDAVALDG